MLSRAFRASPQAEWLRDYKIWRRGEGCKAKLGPGEDFGVLLGPLGRFTSMISQGLQGPQLNPVHTVPITGGTH